MLLVDLLNLYVKNMFALWTLTWPTLVVTVRLRYMCGGYELLLFSL